MLQRLEYKVNLRVGLQCLCKLESSCILLPDTNAKSLQSSQNKVCGILLKAHMHVTSVSIELLYT
jgi:hypothetical protein